MSSHKILSIDCVVHIDAYKNITYTMIWTFMLAWYVSNALLAVIAETFSVASMLLTCVVEIYHGIHNFCLIEIHAVLDNESQNP